jgi:hypothetical protein
MSINAIRQLDQSSAQAAIGRVLNAVLQSAPGQTSFLNDLPPLDRAVIKELAERAKIDLGKANADDWARLLEFGSNELIQLAVGSRSAKQRIHRLGDLGLLELNRYDIQVDDLLKRALRFHGLTEEDVRLTIKEPTTYEHIQLQRTENNPVEDTAHSLFARILGQSSTRAINDLEWCVVTANRSGRQLRALSVLRPSLSDFRSGARPTTAMQLLEESAYAYGMDIIVNNRNYGKWMFEVALPLESVNQFFDMLIEPHTHAGRSSAWFGILGNFRFPVPHLFVQHGFFLDVNKYQACLLRRGVPSKGESIL